MLMRKGRWQAGAVIVMLWLTGLGCSSSNDERASGDRLTFDVVDSLLGPVYEMASADKSFRPPIGFEPVSDSILEVLKTTMVESMGVESRMELRQCFLDSTHMAGVLAAEIEGLMLSSDTTAFLARYRQSLGNMWGQEGFREGEYWVKDVFVKNFLVTDSHNVHFQLICLSDSANAVQLNYFCPRQNYPELVKLFESSIGSLRLIQKGGKQ